MNNACKNGRILCTYTASELHQSIPWKGLNKPGEGPVRCNGGRLNCTYYSADCPHCDGNGWINCPRCLGTGCSVEQSKPTTPPGSQPVISTFFSPRASKKKKKKKPCE